MTRRRSRAIDMADGFLPVLLRHLVGGPAVAFLAMFFLSGGNELAGLIRYGRIFAEVFVVPGMVPAILGAPGAALAWRLPVGWRTAAAAATSSTLCVTGTLAIYGEGGIGAIPAVALIAALVCAITGGVADLAIEMISARWTIRLGRLLAILAIAIAVLVAISTAYHIHHPARITWP